MINIQNLTFSYGDKEIFNNFSIELKSERTVLRGASGRGKTTLLRIIAGLEKNYSGSVSGVPEKISFMFQEDRLLPGFSAYENVAAVLEKEKRDKAEYFLDAVGLSEEKRSLPEKLSGGQQRRVSLARALAFGGGLLILDEPFKGLDPVLTEKMARLILEMKTPVIATLHDEDEAQLLNGEIIML